MGKLRSIESIPNLVSEEHIFTKTKEAFLYLKATIQKE
jgi:hypothetical protein